MPTKSPEVPSTSPTECQRISKKSRPVPLLAGFVLSFALTACGGSMFPGGSLPSETAGASAPPSAGETSSSTDGILGADGTVTADKAAEWCDAMRSEASAGLSDLFPDSTEARCQYSTTGSSVSGEGGVATDTERWLTVSSSYAALPVLAVTGGVECSPSSIPTECSSVNDETLSLFRQLADGQIVVLRYHEPGVQSEVALPALRLVANSIQP